MYVVDIRREGAVHGTVGFDCRIAVGGIADSWKSSHFSSLDNSPDAGSGLGRASLLVTLLAPQFFRRGRASARPKQGYGIQGPSCASKHVRAVKQIASSGDELE